MPTRYEKPQGLSQTTPEQMNPTPEVKAQILQLLHEGKTAQALACCEGFGEEYLLLKKELNTAKGQSDTSLTASEYFEAIKSRINYSLLELMGQLPDSSIPSTSLLSKFRNLFK